MNSDQFKAPYQHAFHIIVAWNDMDALAHVNNVKYFRYFESARIDFLRQYEYLMPMPRAGVGPILAYIECQFILPVTFPDEVIVGSRITEVGNTSVKLEQALFSTKLEMIAARSKSVLVLTDYKTGEKMRVPDAVRDLVGRR
ncbi:MAG TPA: thioesterase family protein [Saprospiraceae bacterium]|nr:thioesterase family protein [Saprospiraceae bacterium]